MSQITIGDKTLNFKDSAYTGDQWEQVASWVLNGGGTLIDENVEIVTQKASETLQAAQNAVASAQAADGSSDLSQSYAVGGTGTRDGENTDNAKYYSEQAGKVVNALNNAHIDERGHLVYTSPGGSTVDLGEVVGKDGVDGSSIQSIERTSGTGAPGTTDTYTVTLTNGDTTTFQVYNGKDGSGSVGVTATLIASGWDADAKTQTVSVAGVTATANGSLRIAQSATDEQFAAWGEAQPRVTAQADGSITVKIAGTVPTIDIPVEVLIV